MKLVMQRSKNVAEKYLTREQDAPVERKYGKMETRTKRNEKEKEMSTQHRFPDSKWTFKLAGDEK